MRLQISKEKDEFLPIEARPAGLWHQTWPVKARLHGIVLSLATGRLCPIALQKSLKRREVTRGLRIPVQVISLFKADSSIFLLSLSDCWSWDTRFTFKLLWRSPRHHSGSLSLIMSIWVSELPRHFSTVQPHGSPLLELQLLLLLHLLKSCSFITVYWTCHGLQEGHSNFSSHNKLLLLLLVTHWAIWLTVLHLCCPE